MTTSLSGTVNSYRHSGFALGEGHLSLLLRPMSAALHLWWPEDRRKGPSASIFMSCASFGKTMAAGSGSATTMVAFTPFFTDPITAVDCSHKYRSFGPLAQLPASRILRAPPALYSASADAEFDAAVLAVLAAPAPVVLALVAADAVLMIGLGMDLS